MKFEFADFSFLQKEVQTVKDDLKKKHTEFLEKTVNYEARNYASKNLPSKDDESIEPYISTIRPFYKSLKNEVSIKLQGGVQRTLGSVNVATVGQNIDSVGKTLAEEIEVCGRLIVDRGRIFINGDHASYRKHRVLLLFIGIGDCLWNISGFIKLVSCQAEIVG
jgi:hypothetical protein